MLTQPENLCNSPSLVEIQRLARAKVEEEAATFDKPSLPDAKILDAVKSNELGDARIFIRLNAGKLCYDHSTGRWYEYSGHSWKPDELDNALSRLDEVVDLYAGLSCKIYFQVVEATKAGSKEAAQELEETERQIRKKIGMLQRRRHRENVLVLAAAGASSLGITGSEWDADPYLLPFQNGVLDLKTHTFRPGRPEDYVKTVCPVPWKGLEAPCPKWEQTWKEVMAGDSEKIGYNKRLLGSTLYGRVVAHKLPIWWGPGGRSGKGTILETLGYCMGLLAGPIQAEILLAQKFPRSPGAPSPEIMAFRGKRLTWASETDENRKLNAGKVKWLCGGDTLVGRNPYDRREVTFAPSHTLLLITNFRPVVNPSDMALWDRIHLVEFPVRFVDNPQAENERPRNPNLATELKKEAAGIMAWLVAGYYEWLEKGLTPPSSVLNSTQEYRQSEDSIEQFLKECCVIGEGKIARAGELREAYINFCKEDGFKPVGEKKFAQTVHQRFKKDRDKISKYYKGLCLIDNG
jgi:putative DNA primase/helicase